jgi:hypothetical protein
MQQFGVYKVAEIRQKYEQHIRLATKLFEDKNFLAIPKSKKMACLSVLTILLKYVNAKTGKCYPRIQTICDHLGCGRNTVSNALNLLVEHNIITRKRLSSTNLYEIKPLYIVGFRSDVYNKDTDVCVVNNRYVKYKDIIKTNSIKQTLITTKVDEIINRGLSKDVMINNLALLPLEELKQSIKKHPYYIPKAIERKEELDRQKNLVPVEKVLNALKNVGGKKSNAFYRAKIDYNKKNSLDWKGNPKK